MTFAFEWTGRSYGKDSDEQRGIDTAQLWAAQNRVDPARCYQAFTDGDDSDEALQWRQLEACAYDALTDGWHSRPDNVSLIWR